MWCESCGKKEFLFLTEWGDLVCGGCWWAPLQEQRRQDA